MWESQVLLTNGQVVFPPGSRVSPTFDERSARYKWNILENKKKKKNYYSSTKKYVAILNRSALLRCFNEYPQHMFLLRNKLCGYPLLSGAMRSQYPEDIYFSMAGRRCTHVNVKLFNKTRTILSMLLHVCSYICTHAHSHSFIEAWFENSKTKNKKKNKEKQQQKNWHAILNLIWAMLWENPSLLFGHMGIAKAQISLHFVPSDQNLHCQLIDSLVSVEYYD